MPALDSGLIADMIAHPLETRSDSFYFVDGELIMQNKAKYKCVAVVVRVRVAPRPHTPPPPARYTAEDRTSQAKSYDAKYNDSRKRGAPSASRRDSDDEDPRAEAKDAKASPGAKGTGGAKGAGRGSKFGDDDDVWSKDT